MKKFWKMIASAVVAASMVSMTMVSVGATDYGEDPAYNDPGKPINVITDDIIKDLIDGDKSVIYVEPEKASVKEDAIGEIAKGDKAITLDAEEYAVTIDPALITEVKAINLAMDISVTNQKTINEMFGEDSGIEVSGTAIVIEPAQKGDFGMTLTVTIPAATVETLDTESIFVYYISDDGEISVMEDAITENEDGSISIAISHASSYIITDEEILLDETEEIEIDEDEDTDEDVDADADEEAPVDNNPGTGVALAGTAVLALISAAAVATTAKKRK